tara:strand:+ start:2562 stop:2852 length:291 start_codon:yes stop_codon:yes gene_type:complete
MKEQNRIELIRNAVANTNKKVPAEFKQLVDDLKAEKLAEELVVKHGLLEVSDGEVQEEFVSLDAVESDKDDDDFEADENLVDMDQVSESMREIFGE